MSILVAIHDSIEARLAAYLLTGLDHDVSAVGTLGDVRQRIGDRPWSAVIFDTDFPDGPGLDVLKILAAVRFEGAALVLSADVEVPTRVRALEEGADDYIIRPYEPSELLARVKACVRRSRRRMASGEWGVVRAGPIELDVNALEVSLPGNRRERLTPNEMRLLHYLMTHPERTVAHDELETRLFGSEDHATGSNAVGVYVRRLRRKIEADMRNPRYIATIRGSGYRFSAVETPLTR